MTGYVRKDTSNNIADGNIINAADLDAEFDGVQDAFNASTGHKHDGTIGEGAPITVVGPTQDVVVSATAITPKTTNTVDIGSSSLKFKDIFIAGAASLPTVNATTVDTTNIEVTAIKAKDGTASATIADSTGVMTIASSILTTADINGGTIDGTAIGASSASTGAFTTLSASGGITGNLTGDVTGNVSGNAGTVTNGVYTTGDQTIAGVKTFSSNPILSAGTANGVAYLNGSKVLTTGSAFVYDSSGNLGVGGNALYGSGGDRSVTAVGSSSASFFVNETGIGAIAQLGAYNGTAYIGTRNNYPFYFTINAVEQMRLTSTGLGIGTSSPAYRLDVNGGIRTIATSGNSSYILAQSGDGYRLGLLQEATASGRSLFNAIDGSPMAFAISSTEQMRLTSTGLGIGTSSPAWKLDVNGIIASRSDSLSGLRFQTSANDYNGFILYDTSSNSIIVNNYNAGPITFKTSDSERMRLDASGNLGLGVTPSAWSGFSVFQNKSASVAVTNNGNNTDFATNRYYNGTSDLFYQTGNYALMYEQASGSGAHRWFTSSATGTAGNAISFTQAMTLDASGNVQLGTTTSYGRLSVAGGTISLVTDTASQRRLSFWSTSNGNSENAYIQVQNDGATTNTGEMLFATRNSGGTLAERARIDSSGNLLIGATSTISNATLLVSKSVDNDRFVKFRNTGSSSPYGQEISYSISPNNSTNEFFMCSDSSAVRMSVRANGGIANYQANDANLSDRREKTNFAPAKSYLETICAIPVQTFNYADQNMEDDPGTTLGVVAQDVQAVAPELVMESNWGTEENPKMRLSIYQTDLQYALMKCIQEQQAIIESLKADVAALKGAA